VPDGFQWVEYDLVFWKADVAPNFWVLKNCSGLVGSYVTVVTKHTEELHYKT